MWHELEIRATEGVALPGGEVGEGHLVGPTDLGFHMVDLAREAVGRKPLHHGVRFEECPIDLLRRSTDHSVKPDGIRGHQYSSFLTRSPTTPRADCRPRCPCRRGRRSPEAPGLLKPPTRCGAGRPGCRATRPPGYAVSGRPRTPGRPI